MLRRMGFAGSLCVAFVAGCLGRNEEVAVTDSEHRVKASDLSEEDARSVDFVRTVVNDYADIRAAVAAGYREQYPAGCVQTSVGSQGVHYANAALLDGKVLMNRPELLMYEPQVDGSLVLVGVDYVVPFQHWTDKEPPILIGRRFVRNEPFKAWTLHIWTHRQNSHGVFAMYNPNVTCRASGGSSRQPAQSH